jgi:hypothetical protein
MPRLIVAVADTAPSKKVVDPSIATGRSPMVTARASSSGGRRLEQPALPSPQPTTKEAARKAAGRAVGGRERMV